MTSAGNTITRKRLKMVKNKKRRAKEQVPGNGSQGAKSLDFIVVSIRDTVDYSRQNSWRQGLAVLLQPPQQVLLLDSGGVQGVPPCYPLQLLQGILLCSTKTTQVSPLNKYSISSFSSSEYLDSSWSPMITQGKVNL